MKKSKKMMEKRKKYLLVAILLVTVLTAAVAVAKLTGGVETSEISQFFVKKDETKSADQVVETNEQTASADTESQNGSDESQYSVSENESNSDSLLATTALMSSSSIYSLTRSSSNSLDNAQVSSGYTFEAVLKTDGTVWTWGNNTYGQLGNGNVENVSTMEPNKVLGVNGEGYLENIKQISAGAYTVAAVTSDGKVASWGRNTYGQLGNNSTTNSGVPVYLTDVDGNEITNIKQVSAGSSHLLALANDGTVWACGLNNYGQLGINVGSTTSSNANYKRIYAVKVQKQITVTADDGTETTELVDLDNIKQVSGGTDFSVALANDGTVYSWGLGTSGQIGNGAATTVYIPTQTSITNVEKIDAGWLQTIALKDDGTVWGWGINRYGNLGINTASTSTSNAAYKKVTPVQVLLAASTPITDVTDIASIGETSFAITSDGNVYGWGFNTSGQIGDNTLANKTVATQLKTAGLTPLTGIKCLPEGQYSYTNIMMDKNGYLYGNGVASTYQLMSERTYVTHFVHKLDETYLKLSNNQEYLEVGNTINLTASYYKALTF